MRVGTTHSRLPACVGETCFEPGPLMPHGAAVLDAVAGTVTRCSPWLRLYLGPRLWSVADADADLLACRPVMRRRADGRTEYEHHGLACWESGVLLVAGAARLPAVLATVHHEIWHGVEPLLSPAALSAVNAAVQDGRPRPGVYLDSAVERRARLYESWASAVDEGHQVVLDGRTGLPAAPLDRILAHVYTGRLAAAVAARDAASAARPRPGIITRVWWSVSRSTPVAA